MRADATNSSHHQDEFVAALRLASPAHPSSTSGPDFGDALSLTRQRGMPPGTRLFGRFECDATTIFWWTCRRAVRNGIRSQCVVGRRRYGRFGGSSLQFLDGRDVRRRVGPSDRAILSIVVVVAVHRSVDHLPSVLSSLSSDQSTLLANGVLSTIVAARLIAAVSVNCSSSRKTDGIILSVMEQVSFDFPVSAEPSVPALETIEATFLLRADSHPPMRHTYDVAATDDVGAIVLHQPCVALQYGSGRVRLPYYRGAVLLIGTGRYQSRPDLLQYPARHYEGLQTLLNDRSDSVTRSNAFAFDEEERRFFHGGTKRTDEMTSRRSFSSSVY
ncbi:unnamed protein product [Heligmosomoides polygyrus]|uniref:Uncharacterized protein n=1 Tax=Heligmosomoides polygyrus TaxID=6339 RepID=A0A3P7YWJ0_HELPZ|nr:unnamed protein product [Heligmosomoides polygyrus]